MARVTVDDCLEHVESRFQLVLVATKRTRQLLLGSAPLVDDPGDDKPTVLALREIAEGLIGPSILDEKVTLPEFTFDDRRFNASDDASNDTDLRFDDEIVEVDVDIDASMSDEAIDAAIAAALGNDVTESEGDKDGDKDGDSKQEEADGKPRNVDPAVEDHG